MIQIQHPLKGRIDHSTMVNMNKGGSFTGDDLNNCAWDWVIAQVLILATFLLCLVLSKRHYFNDKCVAACE